MLKTDLPNCDKIRVRVLVRALNGYVEWLMRHVFTPVVMSYESERVFTCFTDVPGSITPVLLLGQRPSSSHRYRFCEPTYSIDTNPHQASIASWEVHR